MIKPDYQNSIVNLMSSLVVGLGGQIDDCYKPLSLLPPEQVASADHVVLLVIDGLGYHYIQEHGNVFKDCLKGPFSSVFPSSTAPAITSFTTATAPQQHAITGWFMALKELGAVTLALPYCSRCGNHSFAGTGPNMNEIIAASSVFDQLPVNSHYVINRKLVKTAYSRAAAGQAQRLGYSDFADCLKTIESLIERAESRSFTYAYWPVFDGLSHAHGVGSQVVAQHYRELEREFAKLLNALQGSNTLVIATADHGFIDTRPGDVVALEDYPEIKRCLALPLCGEPRVAYCYVRPQHTDRFERLVNEQLGEAFACYPSETLIKDGWFGYGEPDTRLFDRVGDYVLIGKNHHLIYDRVAGEGDWSLIGIHGGVTAAEMHVPLVSALC